MYLCMYKCHVCNMYICRYVRSGGRQRLGWTLALANNILSAAADGQVISGAPKMHETGEGDFGGKHTYIQDNPLPCNLPLTAQPDKTQLCS